MGLHPGGEGGLPPGGGLHPGGRGVHPWGVCVWGRGSASGGGRGLPYPSVNRMTDGCKHNTLPQTSFAGGNNLVY